MGTSITWYTSTNADAQEAWDSSYDTTGWNTFGYPGSTSYWMIFRVQPGITQLGERVVIDSAVAIVQAYNGNGDGAFTAPVNVHDGSCPNLSAAQFAFDAVNIGTDVEVSIPSTHDTDDTVSADVAELVQLWFDRAGFGASDWLGVKWEDGDSAKNEYWDVYVGSAGSPNGCRVACSYHKASKAKWNGTPNANIKVNGAGSDNLNPLQ